MERDPRSVVAVSLVRGGYSHETAEQLVQAVLDAHAHELEEKIREAAKTYVGGAFDGAHAAADLIKPKKEK